MTHWYWVVDCDNTVDNPLVVGKADIRGISRQDLLEGKRITSWDEGAWFQSEGTEWDGDPDDVLQDHLDVPIYSSRLQGSLDQAGISGVQYLSVQVLLSDNSRLEGFAVANILTVVDALDLDKSDYDVFTEDRPDRKGEIRALRKPILRRRAVEGHDIIRPKEFKQYIFVSDRFKRVFESGGFTGYSFHKLDDSDR